MNFCEVILILKMEENKQHFWHIMLYYFKKGKNVTETQKWFVQYVEKTLWLWLIGYVKSGLWSFMLEISCWTMLHSRAQRPVEVDSDQINTLIEISQCSTMQELANLLKISKSIKLLVKMKSVSFILQKQLNRLFGQPDTCIQICRHIS